MTWDKLCERLEPLNFLLKLYCFETIERYPFASVRELSGSNAETSNVGYMKSEYKYAKARH
jgi:hypothetical protein